MKRSFSSFKAHIVLLWAAASLSIGASAGYAACCYEIYTTSCKNVSNPVFTSCEDPCVRTHLGKDCGRGSYYEDVTDVREAGKGVEGSTSYDHSDYVWAWDLCFVSYSCQVSTTLCKGPGLPTYQCEKTDNEVGFDLSPDFFEEGDACTGK